MINPVYYEYRRSTLLGVILVLLLSLAGAVVHYLRSVDDRVARSQQQLQALSVQLDAEFSPVLVFAEAVRRTALTKLALPAPDTATELTVLQLNSVQSETLSTAEDVELQMLSRLWPYFELAQQAQSHLTGMYYVSEQGFAVNGQTRWPDYVADQLVDWLNRQTPEASYQRDISYHSAFLPEQAALTLPLYADDIKLGKFVFSVSLKTLLAPLQQINAANVVLLDTSGEVIHSASALSANMVTDHMLQVQRLNAMPWSVALLEAKGSVFAAGFKEFIWHWLAYAVLLSCLLAAMQYRYRRRTLSPFNRLQVHVERLLKGQEHGVRHVPQGQGWRELFDRILQLSERHNN